MCVCVSMLHPLTPTHVVYVMIAGGTLLTLLAAPQAATGRQAMSRKEMTSWDFWSKFENIDSM